MPQRQEPAAQIEAKIKASKAPVRHRVVEARMPRELVPACESLSRHVKDLHNTCIYLGRTALDCFRWDSEAKKSVLKNTADMPKDGEAVLAAFNAAIAAQNAKRAGKNGAKAKLLPLLDSTCGKPASVILDATLFEGCVRSWPDGLDAKGRPAYGRLPSWLANHAVQKARGEFTTWLAQIRDYRLHGSGAGAGLPGMPGFWPKGELPGFGMSLGHSRYKAHFPKLPAELGLRLGADKAQALSEPDAKAFEDFDLGRHLDAILRARHGEGAARFDRKEIRIIPDGRGARLQIVVSEEDVHPKGSFLSELARRHPKAWADHSSDPDLMADWVRTLASTQTWNPETMDALNPHAWISQGYEALGIDPGVANLAAVASTGGARALVFSATQIERKLAGFDAQIDRFISKNTSTRLRELDAKRSKEGALPLNERIERKTLIKALHANPQLKMLRKSRADYSKEMAHKLSSQIAAHAKRRGAAIVFLSRNKGLKNGAGIGRVQERRSHRLQHDLIAQLLRYKLWETGAFLLETEESFTSLASFVDGDPLPVHPAGVAQSQLEASKAKAKRNAQAKKSSKIESQQAGQSNTKKEGKAATGQTATSPGKYSGARGTSGNQRHGFSRQWPSDAPGKQPNRHRRKKVHADGQAALNAIRKASPGFACTQRVNLGHEIWIASQSKWRPWAPQAMPKIKASFSGGAMIEAPSVLKCGDPSRPTAF